MCLDGCSDITKVVARTRLLNAKFSAAFGDFQESLRLVVWRPYSKGDAGIADPTAITHSNIDANDISIFKNMLRVGDAVTDHVINGSTNGGGEWRNGGVAISLWPRSIAFVDRYCSLRTNKLFCNTIQLGGIHAWNNIWTEHFICFRNDASCLTEMRYLLAGFEHYSHAFLLYLACILWMH